MSDDLFDGPGSADQITWEELDKHLLLIKPLQKLEGVKTEYGPKDAIEVDLYVLDGPKVGEVYRSGYTFPLVLQGQLKSGVGTGRFSLGRLGQGEAKKGQKPPWKLSDPTDADKEIARRFLGSDFYKKNSASAAPAQAVPVAASTAGDPWGGQQQPQANQPATAAPASDPWGSTEPPF